MFSHNPHPDIPRGQSLPPNAGMRQAMEKYSSVSELSSPSKPQAGGGTQSWLGDVTSASQSEGDSPYMPRDVFVTYTCKPGRTDLEATGTRLAKRTTSGIGFEQKKYEAFVARKAAGTLGKWELERKTVQL